MLEHKRKEHDQYQSSYFDQRVGFFAQPIPDVIEDRTQKIILSANLNAKSHVLDVGTGCGVLINHFLASGVKEENVFGVDLSEKMLAQARTRFPKAHFWHGDILDFRSEQADNRKFDAIFFNACFGNIFDQEKAIEKSCQLLSQSGIIIISHPMGAKFVVSLHNQEPELVPHLLPNKEVLQSWSKKFDLILTSFVDEPQLYTAILKRKSQ